MDSNKQRAYEEAHDDNLRKLNQAEEIVSDYQHQIQQKTRQIVEHVYSFYQDIPGGFSSQLSQPFEAVFATYQNELKLKQQEIEAFRDEERRDFSKKMDW